MTYLIAAALFLGAVLFVTSILAWALSAPCSFLAVLSVGTQQLAP